MRVGVCDTEKSLSHSQQTIHAPYVRLDPPRNNRRERYTSFFLELPAVASEYVNLMEQIQIAVRIWIRRLLDFFMYVKNV